MPRRHDPLKPLQHEQGLAADPFVHAAVSASAGTGKTQVLTARVLRLLLGGVRPESILCLTFTKAGAAEMSNRISERLARWVRMKRSDLAADLENIGERMSDQLEREARRLFARVLEAPGGLRIQTIHSFAQALLDAFPAEAGITPGFQPIEGRAEQELARRTLAALAEEAERSGSSRLIADIQALSMRLGEQGAEKYLLDCAHRADSLADLGLPEDIEPALRRLVGLPDGDIETAIVRRLDDSSLDLSLFERLIVANRAWGSGAKATTIVANLERFLVSAPSERASQIESIGKHIVKAEGEICKPAEGQRRDEPDYDFLAQEFADWRAEILSMRSAAQLVAIQAAGLRAGQAYATAYDRAKRAAGVADFNDLIKWTRRLLETPGMGDWVRFKLDRKTDHILVDEAQDTNEAQWAIVDSLTKEFFSGSSEAENRWRTVFTVGDFKQAIFRFQGTDPTEYERMRARLRESAAALEEAAGADPDILIRELRELSISASFRSSPAILQLVDSTISVLGHESMGLPSIPEPHRAFHADRPGRIEWWPALDLDDELEEDSTGDEGWLGEADRVHAGRIARQVRAWLDEKPVLASTGRPLAPGDVLILVRSRGELASLIVARLFAERVPVAGIDRLHLHRPLAVKDLLSAIAFVVQPLDDLNLAGLLVSPLIGWTQEELYAVAYGRRGGLWPALLDEESSNPACASALGLLRPILSMADYSTPSRFLEQILSGPMKGRRKLLQRLGPEARDPIEELVSAALEFERIEIPSLDRFLAWFSAGDVEIKRDPSASVDAVRVMTVHGAKGLEAPVVILADSTADPDRLGSPNPPIDFPVRGAEVPLVRPRKAEQREPFATLVEREASLDRAEHWRLLYVALTRSREHLLISGVRKKGDATRTWHHVVEQALERIGGVRHDDGRLVHEVAGATPVYRPRRTVDVAPSLPSWLFEAAPQEAKPPRPLAPSALAEDDVPYPPPAPGEMDSARRGTLLHRLFERLPEVDPDSRRDAALRWLEHSAGVADASLREDLADVACSIIGHPDHRALFAEGSLAEAPIAATLPDGRVIAGAVDRLLVSANRIRLIDFKTGSRIPADADSLPRSHRLQMEAYREALKVIFPGRTVEAALLYTAGPKIIDVPG